MLHSRQNNKKIKHLHERCLRPIQKDKLPSYEELLEKDVSVSARNIPCNNRHISIGIINSEKTETTCDEYRL